MFCISLLYTFIMWIPFRCFFEHIMCNGFLDAENDKIWSPHCLCSTVCSAHNCSSLHGAKGNVSKSSKYNSLHTTKA